MLHPYFPIFSSMFEIQDLMEVKLTSNIEASPKKVHLRTLYPIWTLTSYPNSDDPIYKSRHEPMRVRGCLRFWEVFWRFWPVVREPKRTNKCKMLLISCDFLLCCTCWTLIARYFLICSKCWTMMYYTNVYIYFPNYPRNIYIQIAIIFRNAPNIKYYRLPLTNTRPLSGKSYPERLSGGVPSLLSAPGRRSTAPGGRYLIAWSSGVWY